jgi:hypothetical protein
MMMMAGATLVGVRGLVVGVPASLPAQWLLAGQQLVAGLLCHRIGAQTLQPISQFRRDGFPLRQKFSNGPTDIHSLGDGLAEMITDGLSSAGEAAIGTGSAKLPGM